MDQDFKNALLNMFGDDAGRSILKKKNVDYPSTIAQGAIGETGENYYFFIFKDIFGNTSERDALGFGNY